ncbi:flippase [Patescibacteria group bacterium]|nr:flippase [Patescibacteria group bacterium]
MSTATRKIALNTGVQVIGKIAVTLVAAISVIILTRYLGATDYGKFNLAISYLSLFSIFADVGLFTIVVREISKEPKKTEEILGNVMTLRLALAVVVILLAGIISLFLPYTPDVRYAILIVGVSVLFGLVNSSMVTVFQARLRMDYAVISDTVGRIVAFLAVVTVAWLNLGFYAIVWTAAIGAFASLLVTYYFARKMVRIRFLRDYKVHKTLLLTALPLGLAVAINQIYFRADIFLLSLFRPYSEVGMYALAAKLLEIILSFAGFFQNSVFPLISRYVANSDARLKSTFQTSFDVLVAAGIPLTVGGVILAPAIIRLAGGAQFAESAGLFQVLIFAITFAFITGLFSYGLIAKEKISVLLWLNLGALAFNVVLNVIFIPIYGAMASAVITSLSEGLIVIAISIFARHLFGYYPSFSRVPRILLAAAVMGVFLWALRDWTVFFLVPAGALLYAGALYLVKGIDMSVVAKLRKST